MKYVLHTSDSRGTAFFGWLHSRHTFSFGRYYDPQRIHFGALRVLNDDIVEGGQGFGSHPHDNMEIVSIPLSGALAHKDSTGNTEVIHTGDVQIMSAGSGLTHSEFNHSRDEKVNFLQVWVLPKLQDISPRYDQKTYSTDGRKNRLQTIVAPDNDEALWINQDAWFHRLELDKGKHFDYHTHQQENGIYVFVIEGTLEVKGIPLKTRDGIGIYEKTDIELEAKEATQLLIIEVPMTP